MITTFDDEPPLGTRILMDDQAYDLVAAEPYTRKSDGKPSRVLEWETVCPAPGCGQPFRVITGLAISNLARRCTEHRAGLRPVKGKRGRKVRVKVQMP